MRTARTPVALAAALTLCGAADASAARVFFTAGEQLAPVKRAAPTPAAALRALLAGPTRAERRRDITTQIPRPTRLDEVTLRGEDLRVELTAAFTRGDAAALRPRLVQVVQTATDFPAVDTVTVVAGGRVVADELGRADFARPPVYVGGPAPAKGQGPATPETTELQQPLAALRYLPADAVDGIAGYRTTQAVMAFQAWEGLTRDGIAGPQTRARLAAAKAPRPFASGPARRIEVDRARGVALLIRRGRVVRAIHVSTGAGANATPTGTYEVFRKELRSWSVPYSVWLPYASYFNNGIAFHESPDVPAHPASHGCVRVPAPEAPLVYAFAKTGTTVIVR